MTELTDYERRLTAAQQELEQAELAAQRADERLSVARRQADALEQIVAGLRALRTVEVSPQKERLPVGAGEVTGAGGEEDAAQPRGREAVRRIMRGSGRAWKQADLIAEVRRRRWIDPNAKQPEAAIRVAVRRLAKDGELEKVPGTTGVYRYRDSSVTALDEAARAAGEPEAPMTTREV